MTFPQRVSTGILTMPEGPLSEWLDSLPSGERMITSSTDPPETNMQKREMRGESCAVYDA